MKATPHRGSFYICTNLNCGCTSEFTPLLTIPTAGRRCVCGSGMKKPYATPSMRVLSKYEAEAV